MLSSSVKGSLIFCKKGFYFKAIFSKLIFKEDKFTAKKKLQWRFNNTEVLPYLLEPEPLQGTESRCKARNKKESVKTAAHLENSLKSLKGFCADLHIIYINRSITVTIRYTQAHLNVLHTFSF